MILVGNQRGGATDLARHLTKDENDHVQVHSMRGFVADDLHGAFRESYAMSRATKCKQHLFSLSLNPPRDADVSPEQFEETIDRVEERLGLSGQPRAIVFHSKNGRTHAHAVWSRIKADEGRAVQLSYTRQKMQELSRELYREHGWQMPRGFVRHEERDPRNFLLAEWQQCKSAERDPQKTKEIFQDAWAMSDSRSAFAHALEAHGFILAKGDRRGHIAVDHKGEAYAISRYTGVKARKVKDRLGAPDDLPDKAKAHEIAAERVKSRLIELRAQEDRRAAEKLARLKEEQKREQDAQRAAAEALREKHAAEQKQQLAAHQARLRKGVLGFIDRFTGRKKRTEAQNREESAVLSFQQTTRRMQQETRAKADQDRARERQAFIAARRKSVESELTQDAKQIDQSVQKSRDERKAEFNRIRKSKGTRPRRSRSRDGPKLDL